MGFEYLRRVEVPPGTTLSVPIQHGAIRGVYATGDITITWSFNGVDGDILTGTIWEPPGDAFAPAPFSQLKLTNSGDAYVQVAIRCTEV